jgi:calcium-translocating P-type ATPase
MADLRTGQASLEAPPVAAPAEGLRPADAAELLGRYGPNELPTPRRDPWVRRLARQLMEPMALLLLAAAAVSALALGERVDGAAIVAIVVLNAAIGLVEEGRAARALDALRRMETPTATVLRDGTARRVPAREVVPGDVVLLAAGDRVPADLRLVEAAGLEVDESLLTGESLPVPKRPVLPVTVGHPAGSGVADDPAGSDGMALTGTLVTRGTARGLVTATGVATRLGRIAASLHQRAPVTPLQRELARLTGRLGLIAVVIAAAVFALMLARTGLAGTGLERSFLAAVALAVAAVPEGLATVVAVALALGVRRMASEGAIVRRLPAVETLGSTTVIATDKTGTLTRNRMRVELVAFPGDGPVAPAELTGAARRRVAEVAIGCNDATLDPPAGDPVDLALLEAFEEPGAAAPQRLAVVPFDAERRRMTTLHRTPEGVALLVKGAPETVLERCATAIGPDGRARALDADRRAELLARAGELGGGGMRLLALARRTLPSRPPVPRDLERFEEELALVAMVGLGDPVRAEAAPAVAEARRAGIQVVMVTGDHPGTASAIAAEVGLTHDPGQDGARRVLTGRELRQAGFPPDPATTAVYARVDPEQKLALVEALRASGHVVAVTGDGVNDAPALRRADIGVAMGRGGSDVAREAADMVITDDNLATIVTAVREGRGIYDSIRKVVDYLVAGNLSEIMVVVASLLAFPALGIPLLPLQLLWINLLTDGLPAIALGVDPVDPALMARRPRSPGSRLLSARRLRILAGRAVLIAAAAVGAAAITRYLVGAPWEQARTVMFSVLVGAHLLYAFVARRPDPVAAPTAGPTPWHRPAINRWLIAAVGAGMALQAVLLLWPPGRVVFDTVRLDPRAWSLAGLLAVAPAALMLLARRLRRGGQGP